VSQVGLQVRVISVIEDEEVIKKILKHLDLWDLKASPPPKRVNAPGVDGNNITLTFELKVTDNVGKTDTDTCTVTAQKKDADKDCFISTAVGGVGY